MQFELTAEELDMLKELVEWRLGELGPEIRHTRTPDYHDRLKELKQKLKALHQRMEKESA